MFNRNPTLITTGVAGMFLASTFAVQANANGEVSVQHLEMSQLPSEVASAFENELMGEAIEEIEKISYEGIAVLYEAEYQENGQEREIYVRSNGEVAARHSH